MCIIYLGIHRVPTAVSRRVYLSESEDLTRIIYTNARGSKPSIEWLRRYQPWLKYQVHKDANGPYVDVVLSSSVKEPSDNIGHLPNLRAFLNHTDSIKTMLHNGLTKRRLQDITDIFILDYLNLNAEYLDDWVKSESRLVAVDNGESFALFPGLRTCPQLIHCPARVCGYKQLFYYNCSEITPVNNCRFHAQTVYSLYMLDTRYANTTDTGQGTSAGVIKLLRQLLYTPYPKHYTYGSLGERLQQALKTELIPANYGSYFGVNDLYEALDARLNYLLDYIESCHETYGDTVFI